MFDLTLQGKASTHVLFFFFFPKNKLTYAYASRQKGEKGQCDNCFITTKVAI